MDADEDLRQKSTDLYEELGYREIEFSGDEVQYIVVEEVSRDDEDGDLVKLTRVREHWKDRSIVSKTYLKTCKRNEVDDTYS